MSLVSRIRGRKAASAAVPTDWREWPEWRQVNDQENAIRAQAGVAESDLQAAQEALTALRADLDRADLAAILGDAPGHAAEAFSSALPAAERAVAEAARRVERFAAAGREMEIRRERVRGELTARFREAWRLGYRVALERAAHAANDAALEQEQLATLWVLGAEHQAATPDTPGPLPALRPASSAIAPWLAAVRASGVDV
jgi:hypothetical protein